MSETAFRPTHATGPDLAYRDTVQLTGQLTPDQLKSFIKARRSHKFGPTTIYYAGVAAPAISAASLSVFKSGFQNFIPSPLWLDLVAMLCAASAGLSWYLIFSRLAARAKPSRHLELISQTTIDISSKGIEVDRGDVKTSIAWSAVLDIRITKDYIALIIDGTNDILIPINWFGSQDEMNAAATKIAALRPPPFKA